MRVSEEPKEQEALEREGIGEAEARRKSSGTRFWTKARLVNIVVVVVLVLALLLFAVMALI